MKKIKGILMGVLLTAASLMSVVLLCGFTYGRYPAPQEIVPTENISLEIVGGQETVKPGRLFQIIVTQEPWYTTTVPNIEVIGGTAETNGNIATITASPDAVVGSEVTVNITADGITASVSVTVEKIPVERVEISYFTDTIQAGVDFVPVVTVFPSDASFKNDIDFIVIGDYAYKANGRIYVETVDNIPTDNEEFSVTAVVDGVPADNSLLFKIYRPVNSVQIHANKTTAVSSSTSGDIINLGFTVNNVPSDKVPQYIIEEDSKQYVVGGVIGTDGIVNIKSGITNKDARIRVKVSVEGVDSGTVCTDGISVHIPTESISFVGTDKDRTAVQREIDNYDFSAIALPNYASNLGVEYTLNVPTSVATISAGGILSIKPAAPFEQIIITVKSADGVSITKTVTVERVNAASISYTTVTKNGLPITMADSFTVRPDETLTFGANFEPFNTTDKSYSIQLVSGDTSLAVISGNTLTVKPLSAMTKDSPHIILRLISSANGIQTITTKTIYIYVPASSVAPINITADRGTGVEILPVFNGHNFASNKTLTYINYTTTGVGLDNEPDNSKNGKILFSIPERATADTVYTINYKIADSTEIYKAKVTVNKLNEIEFTLTYGKDYKIVNNVKQYRTYKVSTQLEESYSVDITVTYKKATAYASSYGLSFARTVSSNASLTTINADGVTTLTATAGQSGVNNKITYTITITDGVMKYILSTNAGTNTDTTKYIAQKPIGIFNQTVDTVTLNTTSVSRASSTTFSVNSINSKSSYNKTDVKFYLSSGIGVSITTAGVVTLSSDTAVTDPYIYVTFSTTYNGQPISKSSSSIKLTVPTITLDKQSGTGGTGTIIPVVGRWTTISSLPAREGYVFMGYYTEKNGTGAKYYDHKGDLEVTHSYSATTTTLYAYWVSLSYIIQFTDAGGSSETFSKWDNGMYELGGSKGTDPILRSSQYSTTDINVWLALLAGVGYTKVTLTLNFIASEDDGNTEQQVRVEFDGGAWVVINRTDNIGGENNWTLPHSYSSEALDISKVTKYSQIRDVYNTTSIGDEKKGWGTDPSEWYLAPTRTLTFTVS
jgi:hypothetical protein